MNYIPTWNPPDPPQEEETKECPHCQGHDTHFERFADEARNTEVYYCWDCEVYFDVEIEIPF
jgi:transcription elongation factor Elf1